MVTFVKLMPSEGPGQNYLGGGRLKKRLRPEAHPQRFSFSGSGVGEEASSGRLPSRNSQPFQRDRQVTR